MENQELTSFVRMRRLRYSAALRLLVQEHRLSVSDLVLPLFIKSGNAIHQPIVSMPGHYQLSIDQLSKEIDEIQSLKIPAVILFGIPDAKDAKGSEATRADGIIPSAITCIKKQAPQLLVISDLCFCEYMDHGHCGVVNPVTKMIDNDQTVLLLAKQASIHAQAGADVIAPSGMMDGMVQVIRSTLDTTGFSHLPILSYTAKYASSFYGPFREASEGAPQFGDRQSYQMNSANADEAIREAESDVQQGADMLMIKPAQSYLDIIYRVKRRFPGVPLGAYQVSGEFAMIKAAAQKGWIDERAAMIESLLSIKRAGADFIITYFAKEFAVLQ